MTFADIYKRLSAPGNVSLRRKQFELAMNGNVTMNIWLGKQKLGQSDKVETTQYIEQKNEITYTAEWGGTAEQSDDGPDDTSGN